MEIQDVVKEIKQSFRQMMDGSIAQSMRDKGVGYHLNWGATIPRLREKADELSTLYTQHSTLYDLAIALWKENIRECKILATMMMPAEKMLPEIADLWMEQTDSIEIAEMAAFHLYQYLPYAPAMAFQWIASDRPLYQVCGYHILTRLFMDGRQPDERGISELMDQALAALTGDDAAVSHAAQLCLLRFADLGEPYETIARKAVKSVNLEFL